MKRKLIVLAAAAFMFALAGNVTAKDPIFTDNFSKDKLDAKWEWVVPKEGPEYKIDAKRGVFMLTVPGTEAFDHWSEIAVSPQLGIKCPKGDWTFEAKLKMAESTEGANFHAVLFVSFAEFDYLYWGPYRGTALRLERSGKNDIYNEENSGEEVWLQIKKEGSTYNFSSRHSEKDGWLKSTEFADDLQPEKVGFMIKTWEATDVVVELSSVKLY